MKRIFTLSILLVASMAFAQAPQAVNYQGIARDGTGNALMNQLLGLQLTIHSGSPSGTIVYQETFSPTTNQFGLYSVQMGMGIPVTGTFSSINWAANSYFLEVGMDITGGNTYVSAGTSQLISVPYALYAATSGSSTPGPTGAVGPTGANGGVGPTGLAGATGANGTTGPTGPSGGPAGPTGPTGLTGANGATGAAGANGVTGAVGPTGAAGANGVTGAVGPTGAAGANGVTGAVGPTGAAGANGVTGAVGPTGAAGANGVTGAVGPTGAAGANGVTGAVGPTGAAGANGVTGAVGPTGANGATGAVGANGPTGPTGAVGANGATGPTGAVGANGATGPTGAVGANGATGPTGAVGANGATGPTGAVGANGATGPTGAVGANGATGPTGAVGANGATGATGPAGANGATGPTGAVGANGATGATGPAGANGATGATGFLANGTAAGNTPYWDGSLWVLNSSNIFNNGGNVGIATATPNGPLEVATDGSLIHGLRISNSGAATVGPGLYIDALNVDWTITGTNPGAGAGTNKLVFRNYSGAQDIMALTNTGSVGIGTDFPAANLDVSGTTKIGTNGTVLNSILRQTSSIDVPSIPAGGVFPMTVAFPNATIGGTAWVSPQNAAPAGLIITYVRVSAANTIEIGFGNASPIAIDPPAENYFISIIQ